MKTQIKHIIASTLEELHLPVVEFLVEHPQMESHGDYATNVAMVLAKQVGKTPRELAAFIAEKLQASDSRLHKVEVAGPGFINFTLNESVFVDELQKIDDQKGEYGKSKVLSGKKVVVEYTDPNPFKEFHIGHLYSNIVGETISRLIEANGASVWRADYFGDVGMHVAKSIWGLLQQFSRDQLHIDQLADWPLVERIKYLGQGYALGAREYEDNATAKEEMKDLNYMVYVSAQRFLKETKGFDAMVNYQQFIQTDRYNLDQIYHIYTTCRAWSLAYFESIYERLGTRFNGYYPESYVGEFGYQTVKNNLGDIFETGERGAVIFPGSKYGLHDRVFINSYGLPTYECKELGLAPVKHQDFAYDQSLIVTGNEVNSYFDVLIKALSLTHPELGAVTKHIGHGMLRLPEGKMSSRTGNVITGESLLDEAKQASLSIIDQLNPELTNKEAVAEMVGMAAIRYALLKTNLGKDVIFNFEQSITFNGDSGPYLQYTAARAQSVLRKAGIAVSGVQGAEGLNTEEMAVVRWLARFPEVVADAAEKLAPHLVAEYLYALAQRFNTFYNKHSILNGDNKTMRLKLTQATLQVLTNGLTILGVRVPEKM